MCIPLPEIRKLQTRTLAVESTNRVIDNQTSLGQCIDTDGDGFGWNGFATCDPSAR